MPRGGAKWKVSIETKGVLPNIRKNLGAIVRLATEQARQDWIQTARERLHSSKNIYINAIGPAEVKGNVGTIKLTGWLPNALEEGKAPFDMKPGLLKGRNAKRGKNGPYNTVPFRIMTPNAVGQGQMVMPKSIYSMAKQLGVGETLKLPQKYVGLGVRTRLSPDATKWGPYTWKTSPFEGIKKVWQFPGQQSGPMMYRTFRRVSRRSDPNSWIHPGFQARNLMEEAAAKLDKHFADILNQVV